jgi:hypothetical protein
VHRLSREDFGRWVLFYVGEPGASGDALQNDPGWWWMGLGAVKTGGSKEESRYLAALGQEAYRDGAFERARRLFRRAVDAYAFSHQARQLLIQALERLGREGEAVEESQRLSEMIEPHVKTSAEFGGALQLLGYTLASEHAEPGQAVRVRYFWKVKRDLGHQSIGVFVHVQSKDGRFREDHRFLGSYERNVWPVLEGEILSEDAWIRIPENAAPGTYRILLGVNDLSTGKRWKVSANDVPARLGRVLIGVLHVVGR